MKRVFKVTIILIMLSMMFGQMNVVYCRQVEGAGDGTQSSKTIHPDTYKPTVEDDSLKFNDKVRVILGIIRAIGIVLSVVVLMIIGIKEMTGTVEEKSIIKQALPGYILGVVLVVAMTTLPSIIYEWASKLEG